jgi:hypothetical protein
MLLVRCFAGAVVDCESAMAEVQVAREAQCDFCDRKPSNYAGAKFSNYK